MTTTKEKTARGATRRRKAQSWPKGVRGLLTGFADSGEPLVNFCSNPRSEPIPASSVVTLKATDAGCEVILLFEDSDASRPIIVGCVQNPTVASASESNSPLHVKLDGQQLTLSAEKEIVLRCGESSITLTRAGKVIIRGAYLLSRSTGPNRIKGSSVHLN